MALLDLQPRTLTTAPARLLAALQHIAARRAAARAARAEQSPTPRQRLEAERRYEAMRQQVNHIWLR